MFDYGYNNFEKIQVSGGSVVAPKGTELSALKVVETEVDGKTEQTYYYQDDIYVGNGVKGEKMVNESPIVITPESAGLEDERSSVPEDSEPVTDNGNIMKDIFYIIIDILIGLIVLALVITTYASVKNRKRRRKRRKRRRKS